MGNRALTFRRGRVDARRGLFAALVALPASCALSTVGTGGVDGAGGGSSYAGGAAGDSSVPTVGAPGGSGSIAGATMAPPPLGGTAGSADVAGTGGAAGRSGGGAAGLGLAGSMPLGGSGGSHAAGGTESAPPCGDGTLSGDEECDDGNTEGEDGCSPDCHVECPARLADAPDNYFFYKGANNSCYFYSTDARDWASAWQTCQNFEKRSAGAAGARGAANFHLAALSTVAELVDVVGYFDSQQALLFANGNEAVWVGAARPYSSSLAPMNFLWLNCEPWAGSDYDHTGAGVWAPGQPDTSNEFCVAVSHDASGSNEIARGALHDETCIDAGKGAGPAHPFLCERWPAGFTPPSYPSGGCQAAAP